jgi:hypothetical protein
MQAQAMGVFGEKILKMENCPSPGILQPRTLKQQFKNILPLTPGGRTGTKCPDQVTEQTHYPGPQKSKNST